ncbi:efflux RND transporter periplasmic adaptor subunit [Sansalvadorimonas verongulae]|uniref:efflux RND transporter periplasmic adaptor subunit n=1 Tax=Sansalvadorimonas verongulae TaxID=2172824 RepID=UPI0012BBA7AB|nr:efflux RND transporter periplasmic adaptor subunit [Sansalvadorimonas verongulae]MTI13531.1 efflux RND transporter periplasmic adaptor subunit [Sansalvadorimonas verongulae]
MTAQKKIKPALITGLAFALLPATYFHNQYAISNQPAPPVWEEAARAPLVTVKNVTAGSYHGVIEAYGEVKAVNNLALGSEVTGRVIWQNPAFADGAQVRKGEDLLRLDDTEFQVALANAQQALSEAELALQQEEQQHSQARQNWELAGFKEKPSDLVLRIPQLNAAKAKLKAAQAQVTKAQRDLRLTHVKAPFDAVVLNPTATLGSFIQPGGTLANLQRSDTAEITLSLSPVQWQQLPANTDGVIAKIVSQQDGSVSWEGHIKRLSSTVSTETRQRSLVIAVDKPLEQHSPLLFGSFVNVEIQGAMKNGMMEIPSFALTPEGYIWYAEKGELKRHKTSPSFGYGGQLFIPQSDLPENIQLITQPMASYLPGMKVTTRDTEAAAQNTVVSTVVSQAGGAQ